MAKEVNNEKLELEDNLIEIIQFEQQFSKKD